MVNSSGMDFNFVLKEGLKTTFRDHDADRDGKLSREELKMAFQKVGSSFPGWRADKALRHVDADGDGSISLEKLDQLVAYVIQAMGVKMVAGRMPRSMEIFKKWLLAFDYDHNGKLSLNELTEAFREMGAWFSGSKAQLAMIFADSNGDGLIDIESEIEKLAEIFEKIFDVKILKP